ncbi:MAG: LptA/OstA family protein [Methylacidiphilales bacterium]|nr:LptA/OstA family protein [Candidatus Methylacidiphilales bacterium]
MSNILVRKTLCTYSVFVIVFFITQVEAKESLEQILESFNQCSVAQPRSTIKSNTNINNDAVIQADSIKTDQDGNISMLGNVEITIEDVSLYSNAIQYKKNDQIFQFPQGGLFATPEIKLLSKQFEANKKINKVTLRETIYNFGGSLGNGKADYIELNTETISTLTNASFTTCNSTNPEWRLQAENITINHQELQGEMKNTFLLLGEVPIFYFPYFSFSIGSRKSGFLIPRYSKDQITGGSISIPYYWNIEPESDWTITPYLYFNSGLLVLNEWRTILPNGMFINRLSFINDINPLQPSGLPSIRWFNTIDLNTSNQGSFFSLHTTSFSDNQYSINFGNIHELSDRYTLDNRIFYSYNDKYSNFQIFGNEAEVATGYSSSLLRTDNSGTLPTIQYKSKNWMVAESLELTYQLLYSNQYTNRSKNQKIINMAGLRYFPYIDARTQLMLTLNSFSRKYRSENPIRLQSISILNQTTQELALHHTVGLANGEGNYNVSISYQQVDFKDDSLIDNLDSEVLIPSYNNFTNQFPLAGFDRIAGYQRLTFGNTVTIFGESNTNQWTKVRVLAQHLYQSEYNETANKSPKTNTVPQVKYANQTVGFFGIEHYGTETTFFGYSTSTGIFNQKEFNVSLYSRTSIGDNNITAVLFRTHSADKQLLLNYYAKLSPKIIFEQTVQYNLTTKALINISLSIGYSSCCLSVTFDYRKESTLTGRLIPHYQISFKLVNLFDNETDVFFGKIGKQLQ